MARMDWMSINLKILIPDDSTCLGSIGEGEGGVGQSIFGNNDNHNYSALGVETVETIWEFCTWKMHAAPSLSSLLKLLFILEVLESKPHWRFSSDYQTISKI